MIATVRDISIIFLALETVVIGILMVILLIQVVRLIRMLREEVMPILRSTQETIGTVRGTATFVSDRVIQPVVKVSSTTAGVRQAVRTLLSRGNGRR